MAYCELCGKQAMDKRSVMIDGSVFNVCISCSKRGKPYNSQGTPSAKKKAAPRPAQARARINMTDETILNPSFAKLIRDARTKKGLTHEQMGMQMSEKATLLRKLETGGLKPDMILARKLERFLGIRLYGSLDEITDGEE